MKHSKMRGLIAEKGFNQMDIAKLLNISSRSFSLKINGRREFKQSELQKLSEIFNASIDELVR